MGAHSFTDIFHHISYLNNVYNDTDSLSVLCTEVPKVYWQKVLGLADQKSVHKWTVNSPSMAYTKQTWQMFNLLIDILYFIFTSYTGTEIYTDMFEYHVIVCDISWSRLSHYIPFAFP